MRQTSSFISTYSADVFGVSSALFELGGMVVMHDPSGCNSTYNTHDEPRWYDMDSMVFISGLTEIEAIMGDDEKLINDITETAEELKPAFIAISGTPVPMITGTDFKAITEEVQRRTGIPSFGFNTNGMHSYITGAGKAFEMLAENFVDRGFKAKCSLEETIQKSDPVQQSKNVRKSDMAYENDPVQQSKNVRKSDIAYESDPVQQSKVVRKSDMTYESDPVHQIITSKQRKDQITERIPINIIGATPLDFSINGSVKDIEKWLDEAGFEVISCWAMGSSLEDIKASGKAAVNLVISSTGLPAARKLRQIFGIPYVVGAPVGRSFSDVLADALRSAAESGNNGFPYFGRKKWVENENCQNDSVNDCRSDCQNDSVNDCRSDCQNDSGNDSQNDCRNDDGYDSQNDCQNDSQNDSVNGCRNDYQSDYHITIIGESVFSSSLAASIAIKYGSRIKVVCQIECDEECLSDEDLYVPEEEDLAEVLKKADIVIADPMYRPICNEKCDFRELPHEGFSGRTYSRRLPNIICSEEI